MSSNKLRPLPLLTEINIFILNVAFAIIHVVLKPTGLEPAVSAFCFGNLFGLFIPYVGIIAAFVHVIIRPLMDWILYSGAYEAIILDNKYRWLGLLLAINFVVALMDKSHLNVEGANFRFRLSSNVMARAALSFWSASYEYLQMSIVWDENAELPPDGQYIFACHPHGECFIIIYLLISFSLSSFTSDLTTLYKGIHCTPLGLFHCKGTPFDERFPGICENKLSGIAATIVFKLPGVREFFLPLPYIDASRSVVEDALKANRSLFICTGSGEESLLTKRGEDVLVLSKRKGFVRLALSYGCDIVPIFGIGNSDLFKTYSIGMGMRMWLHKKLHISIPIFHGRYLTPLPYKVPVRVVVGEPLVVPKPKVRGERPDDAVVEEYLKKYIERVKELHKKHAPGRKLRIL